MSDGSITIEVTLTKEQLEKGLKSLKTSINNIIPSASSTLSSFAKGFEKIGDAATSAGKVCSTVTTTLTGVFTAASAKAYSFISIYESAMAVFEKKLGSKTSATEMYNQLLDIAKGSKFAQEYIVSAGQVLVGMGVSASKTAKYVQVATNAISAMGGTASEVESLSEMFGKMSLQTTLYTEDLNQMLTAGIPVYDILAKKYSTNADAIKEMASEAELTSADFEYLMEVLDGNVDGMEEFSVAGLALAGKTGTLSGALDSLNSSFRTFALNLLGVDPRTEEGADSINGLIQVVQTLGAVLETIGEKFSFVGDWIKDFVGKLATVTETTDESGNTITTYGGILGDFKNKLDSLDTATLEKIAEAILKLAAAGPILLTVGKGFNVLSSVFSGLSSGTKIIEGISGSLSQLPKTLSSVSGKLSSVKSIFSTFSSSVLNGVTTMFPKISGAFSSVLSGISGVGSKMASPFITAFSKISNGAKSLGNTLVSKLTSVFPNITSGLSQISSAFGGLFENITPLLSSFGGIFAKAFSVTAVIGLVVAGLGLIQQTFGDKINEIAQYAITQGPIIIQNLVNGIVTAIPQLIQQGSQLIQTLLTVITTNLPYLIQGGIQIISALVTGLAQQLPTLIPMALELILTLVTSLLENIDQLINAGIELIIGLAEGLINAIPILIEKIPIIIQNLLQAIINNLPKIISMGIRLLVELGAGLIAAIPQLIAMIPQIIGAIIEAFFNTDWGEVGTQLLQGLLNGFSNAGNIIWKAIKKVGNSMIDGIKSFFGINSPSRVMRDEVGKFLPQGIAVGVEADTGDAVKAVDDMNESIMNKMLSDRIDMSAMYDKLQSAVSFESMRISSNLSSTALVEKRLTANINAKPGNIYMNGKKVGELITPSITKTLRSAGI